MITLYKPTETVFTHNGEAVLDNIVLSAVILHKLNGEYSLEIELLKDDRGKYKLLRQHSIIKACGQLFRLYSQENIQDNDIKIRAVLYHITYDINLDIIEDYRAVDCKADFALSKVVLDKRFTILETDIETINTAYFVDELPFDGIHKKILARWGGELLQDNFNIGIKKTIGTLSPISVIFKKNINGFTETRDYKGVYTRIKPVGKEGLTIRDINDGSDWLVSPRAGDYFKVLSAVIKFDDIENPLELKNKVVNELWGRIDLPVVSFKVDFIDLSNTVEYERFNNLKGLSTGDTIKIYHEYFNVNLIAKVQETKRNAITGEVEELVLGDLVPDFIEGIESTVEDYVEKKGNTIIKQTKDMISLEVSDVREEINQKYDELGNLIEETDRAIVTLDSKLTVTADEIRGEVNRVKEHADGRIDEANSLIKQNADSISTNVTEVNKVKDKVTGLETTVSEHSTSISQTASKVEIVAKAQADGILKGMTYTFDGDSFRIGGQSGATAEHTDTFSKWTHGDGSYTKIGTLGLERYSTKFNGGRPYHYYTYLGSITGVISNNYVRCNFPEEFKGKDYVVSWWAGNALPEKSGDLMYVCNVEMHDDSTKKQGYITLLAKLMVRNPDTGETYPAYRGKLNVMYMGFL